MSHKVIIVGGGLSGLSAAHTVLERGGNVVSILLKFRAREFRILCRWTLCTVYRLDRADSQILLDKNSFMGVSLFPVAIDYH